MHGRRDGAGRPARAGAGGRLRRAGWEAQLAAITPDEVARRHGTVTAAGLLVCWVSDRDRRWTFAVPSVIVASPDDSEDAGPADAGRDLAVVGGPARFVTSWCDDRRHCEESLYTAVACAGHG